MSTAMVMRSRGSLLGPLWCFATRLFCLCIRRQRDKIRVTGSQLVISRPERPSQQWIMVEGLKSHIGVFLFRRIVLFETISQHPPA